MHLFKSISWRNWRWKLRELFDKRHPKWFRERLKYGFDSRETWCLSLTMARWLLPRLEMFKRVNIATPMDMNEEEWDRYLDYMMYSLRMIIQEEDEPDRSAEIDWQKVQSGFKLIGKYWLNLWW